MSVPTTTPSTPAAPPATPDRNEVVVVSHSNLFYWWPVWACGFLMALLTYIDGHLMTVVPRGTKASKQIEEARVTEKTKEGKDEKVVRGREGLVLPAEKRVARVDPKDPNSDARDPVIHMSHSRAYGVIFFTVLLVVIFITNVPLRGMWSVVIIISVVAISLILHLAGAWEWIIARLSLLDVRINMGGYLMVSIVLFIIWLLTLMFFDKQIYMVFTPGQLKVKTEIGGGEKVYDAIGMTLEKQRSDVFRHRILGLGSGDLIVKTSGAQAHHFDLPNVLFITKKVQMIEDMLAKKKQVVEHR
jgi:hypothetical protein